MDLRPLCLSIHQCFQHGHFVFYHFVLELQIQQIIRSTLKFSNHKNNRKDKFSSTLVHAFHHFSHLLFWDFHLFRRVSSFKTHRSRKSKSPKVNLRKTRAWWKQSWSIQLQTWVRFFLFTFQFVRCHRYGMWYFVWSAERIRDGNLTGHMFCVLVFCVEVETLQ